MPLPARYAYADAADITLRHALRCSAAAVPLILPMPFRR